LRNPQRGEPVMPGLVPGIDVFAVLRLKNVDGRDKSGHNEERAFA